MQIEINSPLFGILDNKNKIIGVCGIHLDDKSLGMLLIDKNYRKKGLG